MAVTDDAAEVDRVIAAMIGRGDPQLVALASVVRELVDVTPSWAATMRPGDRLVLGYLRDFTREQAAQVNARLRDVLPGVEVVIIPRVTAMSVQRVEPTPAEVADLGDEYERAINAARRRRGQPLL